MKTKHARLIRYGIKLARMNTEDDAGPLSSWLLPKLTIRAYIREDINVLKRILRGCRINPVELQPAVDLTAALLADPIDRGDGV